jgi:hypothetical protein
MGALGVTILLGTPLLAQADQGKWWTPKQGDQRVEKRDRGGHGRDQGSRDPGSRGTWRGRGGAGQGTWRDRNGGGDRGAWRGSGDVRFRDRGGVRVRDRVITNRSFGDRGFRGSVTYRDRRFGARGSWGGASSWRGYPVRRDILVIRDRHYGGYFRARRIYCAPRYYGRFVYVRPVRFFIGADACIGGVGIHARIVRPHYLYGCNFCEDRFDSYGAYCQHVEHCGHRPVGLDISVSNWDDGSDADWDGPYATEGSYNDDDDQGQYDDNGYDEDDGGYDDESH